MLERENTRLSLCNSHDDISVSSHVSSVPLQRCERLLNPLTGDDHHLQSIPHLDMPLRRTRKGVLDQLHRRLLIQTVHRPLLKRVRVPILPAARHILVLEVDLVVEEGHDQTRRGAGGTALFTLVAADGVVGVQRAFAFFVETGEDGVHVVREETLGVEDGGEALGAGFGAHALVVLVLVHLDDGGEVVAQREAVGAVAYDGQDDVWLRVVGGDGVELWEHPCLDVVPACAARVTRDDRVGAACYAEGGTAIVGVAAGGVVSVLGGRWIWRRMTAAGLRRSGYELRLTDRRHAELVLRSHGSLRFLRTSMGRGRNEEGGLRGSSTTPCWRQSEVVSRN